MNKDTQKLQSKGFYKLTWLQRIGFGSGDLAQAMALFNMGFRGKKPSVDFT